MKSFFEQFACPEGLVGRVVGQLMAVKNGRRSRFALELLGPSASEYVLEIGFGPGVDLRRLSRAVGDGGSVCGVDVSEVMLAQASQRNRRAIERGQMTLELASATQLPFAERSFDAVYATNSAQFWPDLAAGMREVARCLKPGGRCAIVVQPMRRGATEADSTNWAAKLEAAAKQAGLGDVRAVLRAMKPVSAAAILAIKP